MFRFANCAISLLFFTLGPLEAAGKHSPERKGRASAAALWQPPSDISSRDLLNGPGGKDHQPREPFVFIQEVKGGSNPKFEVRDANGIKWRVKLGEEARPETAATRLLWSVGYFADEDY